MTWDASVIQSASPAASDGNGASAELSSVIPWAWPYARSCVPMFASPPPFGCAQPQSTERGPGAIEAMRCARATRVRFGSSSALKVRVPAARSVSHR